MRKRIRRILLVLAILLVVLLIVPFLIPADRWKNLAIDQLEARTGWQADAQEARLSIFPLGLRLTGIAIEDPDGDATLERFSVRADGVVLRADLASVIRRQPNLQEIRFQKPAIELWMREQPQDEPAASTPTGTPGAPPASSPGVSALLAFVTLEEGQLILHDAEQTTSLRGIDQRAELRLDGKDFQLKLEGSLAEGLLEAPTLPQGRFALPRLELELELSSAIPTESIQITRWELRALGQRAHGDARIDLLPEQRASFQAQFEGEAAALYAGLAEQLPPLPPLAQGFTLEGGKIALSVRSAEPLDLKATPDAMLSAIAAEGTLSDLQLQHFGETLRCASARLSAQQGVLRVQDAQLALSGLTATLQASTPLAPQSDLTTEAQWKGDLRALRALAARVLPQLPEELRAAAPPQAEWPGVAGVLRGQVRAVLPTTPVEDPSQLDLSVRAELAGIALLPPAWRDSLKLAGGQLIATATNADLRELRLSGPGFAGTASGQLWGWPERIESEWDAQLDRVDLDLLQAATMPPSAEKASLGDWLSRPAHAAVNQQGMAIPPANLGAELRVSAKELLSRGYRLHDLQGRASLHDRKLNLSEAQAKLGSGQVDLTAELDWNQDPPRWQGKSKAQGVPAGELLRPFAAPLADALQTSFSGDLALDGPLAMDPKAALAALSGNFALASSAGSLLTEPILGDALAAFLGQHYAKFQKFDFRSLTAGLELKGGQLHFDRFLIDGATQLRVNGMVGVDGRCDYHFDVLLPKGATPQLGELQPLASLLEDEEGRISFRVDVDGPAAKPKVAVDLAELGERARLRAESKAQDELESLIEGKGQEAVESLLDKLRKKKKGSGESPEAGDLDSR